jgi:uncharacterized protein YxeA
MKKTQLIILLTFLISNAFSFIPWKSTHMHVPSHFMRTHEIYAFLEKTAKENPSFIKLVKYGYSYEGKKKGVKNLIALEVFNKSYSPGRVAFLNAGIHSRELMGVYSAISWTKELVEKIKGNSSFWKNYIKKVKLIIIPLLNPDGYEMVMKGYNWRKNARVIKYRSASFSPNSYGVDLNRNFPKFFVKSGFSFHYTWGGLKPFSEPETIALRDYLDGKNIKVSLSLHAYGRYSAFPWWGRRYRIPDYRKHLLIQRKLKKIMRTYRMRQGCPYPIRGNFGDWIYAKYRCLTFTFEIGDKFNPKKTFAEKWYKEIKEGMSYIIKKAM